MKKYITSLIISCLVLSTCVFSDTDHANELKNATLLHEMWAAKYKECVFILGSKECPNILTSLLSHSGRQGSWMESIADPADIDLSSMTLPNLKRYTRRLSNEIAYTEFSLIIQKANKRQEERQTPLTRFYNTAIDTGHWQHRS